MGLRVQREALALCLAAATAAQAAGGNRFANLGLESAAPFTWRCEGRAERSGTDPHSGQWCLYVEDDKKKLLCQGVHAYLAAAPGCYYVEAWLRTDPHFPDSTATLNVQFFGAARQYLGREKVGVTRSTEWTRVSTLVTLPEGAAALRFSILTTAWDPPLRGACYVDDFYLAPAATAVQQGKLHARRKACLNHDPSSAGGITTTGGERPPDLEGKRLAPEAQVGFEDLTGWALETWGDVSASFCRSRELQLGGKHVGKLVFLASDQDRTGAVALRPPQPVPIQAGLDAAQIWCHPDYVNGKYRRHIGKPVITVVISEGDAERRIRIGHLAWAFWSIAHRRLDRPVGPDAKITQLLLTGLRTLDGVPRTFFLDELSFHREPTAKLDLAIPDLPAPTRPETILPTFKSRYENSIAKRNGAYLLSYQGEDGTVRFRYEPRTGRLDDLQVTVDGALTFRPAAGGGPVLAFGDEEYRVGHKRLQASLIRSEIQGDRVRADWQYRVGDRSATVSWSVRIKGKSVVLTVDEPEGKVAQWLFGDAKGEGTREIHVPYLTLVYGSRMPGVRLVANKAFAFSQPDWYVTHATSFTRDGCRYVRPFRGNRTPLHERIFITVSTDFQEILPTIPNPRSPYARVLGENVYLQMNSIVHWKRCLMLLRQMKRLGMDKCIVKHHAETWSPHTGCGNEPFVLTTSAASNIPGGEAGLKTYIQQVKSLGFPFLMYTSYWAFAPVNRCFDERLVTLTPDGQWRRSWYQYRCLTPLMAPVMAARLAPELKAKYGLTGGYSDCHSAATPWLWVDYDARKPGAAMLQTVFRAYAKTFLIEKEAYRGPIVGEGHRYFYYAGLIDGNYAHLANLPGRRTWQVPFLVDFDLLKIHPLEVDLGMSYRKAYGFDRHARNRDEALDRFLYATIAFGHSGIRYWGWGARWRDEGDLPFLPEDPLAEKKRVVARTYFMIQQLAGRYALTPVRSIAYWDGSRLLNTSDAIRSRAVERSQVMVEYENGLRVFANGSFTQTWRVAAGDQAYELPPSGWVAMQGKEFLEYSAIRDGRRVDYVRSPVYTFADGRGVATDFGGLKATNAVIILHKRANERHEIDTPMDW